MIEVIESGKNFENSQEFVKELSAARLKYKGRWIVCSVVVCGKVVTIKNYNLYLQICRINGLNKPGGHTLKTVKEWKVHIAQAIG